MTRTIAWVGLPVSFLWLGCGAGRTGAAAGLVVVDVAGQVIPSNGAGNW